MLNGKIEVNMKRIIVLLFTFILLVIVKDGHAWSHIFPDIYNRGYFHFRRAEEFFDRGNYREAIEELNRAYAFCFDKRERNNVLRKKVISLIEVGNCEEAIETIEKRELGGESENEFLFLKTECLIRLNNTEQAMKIFDTIINQEQDYKNKIFFKIKEGLLFLSVDSLEKAEETFISVLKMLYCIEEEENEIEIDKLKLAMYSLGYINLKNGGYENAEGYFEFLGENFKDEEVGYKSSLYYGLILGIKGQEKESFAILKTVDTEEKSEASAMKGYLFYRNGSFKQAKQKFQSIENETLLNKEIQEMITILSGECCYVLKEYSDAVRYYRKYCEMVTTAQKKMPALYGLAWSYFRLGQYSNAYAVLKDFLMLYPGFPYLPKIERLSALSLFYVGEHAQAKFHFTRLLNIDTALQDKDRIYYLRGKSEFYLREFDAAQSDFDKIIDIFPDSRWKPHAVNMIARINFEKEEYLNAYNTYKKLLARELSPTLLDEVRFQTERCLLHLGYYKNPVEMSRAFVMKYPQSPKSADLQLEVAEYYFLLQKYWEAIREYERFLNLFPEDKSNRFALYKLARSYSQIGYYGKALDIYKELSVGNDEYTESALVSMGDIRFSTERYKESIDAFKELTRRFPESNMKDYANFIIGKNYLELNLPQEARVSFELVVKSKSVFPFKEDAELLIAKTLYLEGKGEEYLEYLNTMIKTGTLKLRAESYFLKAEYKKETGRFKEAMDLYEQSSLAYEENADKIRALYEAGLSAEELMLFDEAKDFYKEALTISPLESARFGIEERIKRIEVIKGEHLDEMD